MNGQNSRECNSLAVHVSWLWCLMCQQLLAVLQTVSFKSIVENSGGLLLLWNKQKSISQCFSVADNSSTRTSINGFMFCMELRFILSDLRAVFKQQREGFKFGINRLLYTVPNLVATFQHDFKGLCIKMDVVGKLLLPSSLNP